MEFTGSRFAAIESALDPVPWALERGFDSIVQAVPGIGQVYGSSDATGRFTPGGLPVQALDVAAGYGMAAAILALLAVRPRRGGGSAHLSLARTASLLLDAGPDPAAQPQGLTVPTTDTSSPHGRLTRAASPVSLDGDSLALPAPGEYGTGDLTWL